MKKNGGFNIVTIIEFGRVQIRINETEQNKVDIDWQKNEVHYKQK